MVHGWQDYNVKQSEGVDLYRALPLSTDATAGAPFKRLYMFQGGHQSPAGRPRFDALLDQFFATTLKGAAAGPDLAPPVITQGRTSAAAGEFREEASWPPAGAGERRLRLGRTAAGGVLADRAAGPDAAFTDTGTTTEEAAMRALDAEASWLAYRSAPLAADLRIAGTPRLDLTLTASADHGHLTPTLVDIAPDGTATALSRGFLNLRYRDGLAAEEPVPTARPITARVGARAAGPHGPGGPPHRRDRGRLQHGVGGPRRAGRHAGDRAPRRTPAVAARAARRALTNPRRRLRIGRCARSRTSATTSRTVRRRSSRRASRASGGRSSGTPACTAR